MTAAIIIILVLLVILYFFFNKSKFENASSPPKKEEKIFSDNSLLRQLEKSESEIFTDENGKFIMENFTAEIPRKTYIKAFLQGKYWGEIDENFSNQFQQTKFFDFNIYEVTLNRAIYSKNNPYKIEEEYFIPRQKLPKLLKTILKKDGKEYEVNLHEPKFELGTIKFNRKLHQVDGSEVFGTIEAIVTGYVLDFVVESYSEKKYILNNNGENHTSSLTVNDVVKTNSPTGNVEYSGNYSRTEYYYSDFRKTYWGEWKYIRPAKEPNSEGCLSLITGIIGLILGIAFLLLILPQITVIIPFILFILLLNLIPTKFFSWIFNALGVLMLFGFLLSLLYFFGTNVNFNPRPNKVDSQEEQETQSIPISDNENNQTIKDTLIRHFRTWNDYDGNNYQGYIWTKKSNYLSAKKYKNSLESLDNERGYDQIIFSLKENDKNNLKGVYQLFDSIRKTKQFSKTKFAELIVSFVQDIPYSVILPDGCDPNLYNDKFIREYLSTSNAKCDGFQKFGINSPVEFMTNLNGDCDTRTLLLYTALSYYGYDVALFSSEYYNHSILGVNLPINGLAYNYKNQRYILWETTAPNTKPGVLPSEISNLNYWRISLKSK